MAETDPSSGVRKSRRPLLYTFLGVKFMEAGRPEGGVLVHVREISEGLGGNIPRNTISSAMGRLVQQGLVKPAPEQGRGWYWVMSDFEGIPGRAAATRRRGQAKVLVVQFMREHPGPHDFREVADATDSRDAHHWLKELQGEGVVRRIAEGIFEWKGSRLAVIPPAPVPGVLALEQRAEALLDGQVEAAQRRQQAMQAGLHASMTPPPPQVVPLPQHPGGTMLVTKNLAPGKRLLQDPDDNTFWLAEKLT